jgi:hypothetical protein
MFRHRVRPPTPPLDEVTAERLLRGASIDDLPVAYRPLGHLLADARRPATDAELAGSAAAAAAFVAAHHAATTPSRKARSMGVSALFALTLAATTGTAVAATQGALPKPFQQVAHEALGSVGISVPGNSSHTDSNVAPANDTRSGGGGAEVKTPTPSTPASPEPGATGTVTGDGDTQGRSPSAPEGVAGANPNTDPGSNQGNGNPSPGVGNQGQGNAGDGNSGNATPSDPGSNLPSPSNGKGNGPPAVPPGQDKR